MARARARVNSLLLEDEQMANIYVEFRGSEHIVSADFSQASSPICVDGVQIPYQVADARHKKSIAVAIALTYIGEADLPGCPAGVTPDEWRKKADACPDWDDVQYRDATDEEVEQGNAR